jgi:hypothetical protein
MGVLLKVTIEIDGESQTFELSDETARDLKQIAARNGLTFATALQQAITNERFLEDQQANGTKLLIEKNGKLRELVRAPEPAA